MDERGRETELDAAPSTGVEAHAGPRTTAVSAYDYLLLYVGCASLAVMGLLAASAFSPMRALALGLLLALVLAVTLRDSHGIKATSAGLADPWLIGILLLALFLRANFSTNYLGGLDPGLYVAFSGVIEHTGGLYFVDLFRAGLPEHLRSLYDAAQMHSLAPLGDGLRYEVAFYPLHPGWMAVFSGLFGADAHGASVVMFSLLGVTGAYFFARELGEGDGVAEARLAAALTAVNPALCYLAKMPLSEAQSTAFIMNAAYLLTKGLRAEGRAQILLFAASLLLVTGFFFTRASFPILLAPAVALYAFSHIGRLPPVTAARLRKFLWAGAAALVLALAAYYVLLPVLFAGVSGVYLRLLGRHPYVLAAGLVVLIGLAAAMATPRRRRFGFVLEYSARASERAALWIPAVLALAGIPDMIAIAKGGMLLFPGEASSSLHVAPQLTAFRYHLFYRLMLALTPFLLGILVALPWLVRAKPRLTPPLVFLGAAWAFTQAFSPLLPNLYYHIRFIASEAVPLSLVIASVAIIAMLRSDRYRRGLALVAGAGALLTMTTFSALQLAGVEGEDARFFRELDRLVSRDDVIVINESDDPGRFLVSPIRLYLQKNVFFLSRGAPSLESRELIHYLLDNSKAHRGRVLLLSTQPADAQPFGVTLEALLPLTQSGISNTENFRFEAFQSTSLRNMVLPTVWRTQTLPFHLYVVRAD
jgi:hypothetical protein